MGYKHINTLKEAMPTPSEERVGEDNIVESLRNGVDRQKTNVGTQQPEKMTYADIVKSKSLESEKSVVASLTFQKSHRESCLINFLYKYILLLSLPIVTTTNKVRNSYGDKKEILQQ